MITKENFVSKYEDFVRKWFHFRNNKSSFRINEEDFWSEVLSKIVFKELLDKYDKNHYSGASFETWLKKVLNHLYIDMVSREFKNSWIPIDKIEDDENTFHINEERFIVNPIDDNLPDIDTDLVISLINKILKIKNRILVKLKWYNCDFIKITKDEYEFLQNNTEGEIKEIEDNINQIKDENTLGLKDKHIAKLLGMKLGTVNTTYQRVVRKYIKDPYTLYKAKND